LKTITPYGGRLSFKLPGGNFLIIHLKDKSKIRNKKRWSQVMYMYYLLGYKYFGDLSAMESLYTKENNNCNQKTSKNSTTFTGYGNLLNNINSQLRDKVLK
jgi:chitin synthase